MQNFRFDLLSFWIGFLAATIFWGLISFLRPRIPGFKAAITKTVSEIRARNSSGLDAMVRREVLRRSQRMHLSANFFALDEVLIEPRLIAPPSHLEKPDPIHADTLIDQTIPYTPDWPELSVSYAVTKISLAEAMQNGANIAIIGEPGTGKTVTLAHLVSVIARKSPEAGSLTNFTPCLVNVQNINLNPIENQDPIDVLIKAISSQFSLFVQPQIPRYLRRKLNENTLLLLLDGIDELPPQGIAHAGEFIGRILDRYPSLRIAIAASPHYLDGFLKLGFYPLSVAGWSIDDQTHFLKTWGNLWSTYITPGIEKQTEIREIPQFFMNNWLLPEQSICTPFEWTIRTWMAYSGEANGLGSTNWLDEFISHYTKDPIIRSALEKLALNFCVDVSPSLAFSECETFLNGLSIAKPEENLERLIKEVEAGEEQQAGKTKKAKETKISFGGRIIENFLKEGFLTEYKGERITFLHPIITGYMASFAIKENPPDQILENTNWPIARLCLQYLAAQLINAPWVERFIKEDRSPLFHDILMVGRWIKDAPLSASWRSTFMRKLISLVQSEAVPLLLRARLMSVCISAKDPSIPLLIKQLIQSRSHIVRQLAALAYGALPTQKSIDELVELMVDPVVEVRNAACLALAAIRTSTARDALIDILMRGDESLQQAAAESLAYRGEEGFEILRAALTSEDLLVRRAVILGLSRIREDWSKQLIEKTAVEDGQWVVRNVAAQALDEFQVPRVCIPEPLPPATQAPWLLEFAGKQGVGLRPDQPATEMLLSALKSGTQAERISALRYLRLNSEEGIIGAIYQIAFLEQNRIADAGMYAIWFIMVSGAKLPALAQYGVG